ncbi:MAG: 8-amino-7-oxononanoate synthase, partial [Candidatus Electrothrix sp. GM3_4]|nr:8-amino-7-oxononanoate synthase [Candidatus Electrothrix sp. GM3_4]
MDPFTFRLTEHLQILSDQGVQREILPVQPTGSARLQYQDREYLNLAGNDYLGLAGNPILLHKFYAALEGDKERNLIEQYGLGSGASRLMTGNHDQYARLEEKLARSYQKDKALVFNSGYHINIGLL